MYITELPSQVNNLYDPILSSIKGKPQYHNVKGLVEVYPYFLTIGNYQYYCSDLDTIKKLIHDSNHNYFVEIQIYQLSVYDSKIVSSFMVNCIKRTEITIDEIIRAELQLKNLNENFNKCQLKNTEIVLRYEFENNKYKVFHGNSKDTIILWSEEEFVKNYNKLIRVESNKDLHL